MQGLSKNAVADLAGYARTLGLEVLLEIHKRRGELGHICDTVDMVGVNNRDLKTFRVDIGTSLRLINKIPTGTPAVAESGISDAETINFKTSRLPGFS